MSTPVPNPQPKNRDSSPVRLIPPPPPARLNPATSEPASVWVVDLTTDFGTTSTSKRSYWTYQQGALAFYQAQLLNTAVTGGGKWIRNGSWSYCAVSPMSSAASPRTFTLSLSRASLNESWQ